ncbi:thymidylate kinase [Erwinia phage AH06]|nr:thymidylate kinase [Erwinia phage AH06]
MSKKKQVTVFVAGDINSAKTTVIAIIEKALKEAGIDAKLLSHAAADAEYFVGEKLTPEHVSAINEKVEVSIEELTYPAPLKEDGSQPTGYAAIRHSAGIKIIPRGVSPAE